MVFNSLTFLVFFALVLLLHNLPFSWRARKLNLILASYVFYAWWNPPFVLLLMLSTVVDWFAARGIYAARTPISRRIWLCATLGVNLGVLAFFKYGKFLLANFVALVNSIGIHYQPPQVDIILPIGISFYTFVTLSYTLDVYSGNMKPWTSFLDYALLVTFFPHLVAGPILRASYFLPQCLRPRPATRDAVLFGLALLLLGLFEKVTLADCVFAPVVESVYGKSQPPIFSDAWLGTMAFSGQIFCDFAGYSTCAIGIAICLGFSLPENFRYPYAAIGFSDFWRRWHISLSSWLRDYLYIPLGGNRLGTRRTYSNLLTTMLLGGLWHGAAWTFVAWGGLHGLYLAGERLVRNVVPPSSFWQSTIFKVSAAIATYALICITWVFFRAHSFGKAFDFLTSMFGHYSPDQVSILDPATRMRIAMFVVAILAVHWLMRDCQFVEVVARTPWWIRSVALTAMLIAVLTIQGENHAFIYFQF